MNSSKEHHRHSLVHCLCSSDYALHWVWTPQLFLQQFWLCFQLNERWVHLIRGMNIHTRYCKIPQCTTRILLNGCVQWMFFHRFNDQLDTTFLPNDSLVRIYTNIWDEITWMDSWVPLGDKFSSAPHALSWISECFVCAFIALITHLIPPSFAIKFLFSSSSLLALFIQLK